jgi:hypothetical protein
MALYLIKQLMLRSVAQLHATVAATHEARSLSLVMAA